MSDSPRISVVTPTLNRVDMLGRTLACLQGQTLQDFEHIVIDGGSRDGTIEMLAHAERSYPLRWISEPDKGMYEAINKGLRMARGDILAYLNSDDLYFPWTLATVARSFDHSPDLDVLFGDAITVDESSGATDFYWTMPFDRDGLCHVGYLPQPAVFWQRRVYEAVGGFDEGLRFAADCDYWMRASADFSVSRIPEFLAIEYNHGETLRERHGDLVRIEEEAVRRRYVRLEGPHHRFVARRYVARQRLWFRLNAAGLLCQSMLPAHMRRSPWRSFLGSGNAGLMRWRIYANAFVPPLGRKHRGRLMEPPRSWLEQGE